MPTDEPQETCLLLSIERDKYGGTDLEIIGRPVHLTSDGHVRNITGDSYAPDPLADLQIRARADREATFGDTYGWSYEYRDVFSIDRARATVMAKQLGSIERRLVKLEQDLSYASDFGAYVARFALALKIKRFGWKVSGDQHGWSHDDQEYRWGDAMAASYWLERQLADFRKVETH